MRQLSGSTDLHGSHLPERELTAYPLSDMGEPRRFAMFGRFAIESHLRRDLCRKFQKRNKIEIPHLVRRRAGTLADFPRKRPDLMEFRTGYQLYTSVVEYLNWRSGASWRPMSHRFREERLGYLSAAFTLNQAYNSLSPGECACPAPFYDERKPAAPILTPQSRQVARRARA